MNIETVKSFILALLVGISLFLSYILWSYQPKYELFYDANYINEVDVGGKIKTTIEIIKPEHIIFHRGEKVYDYVRPENRLALFQEILSWEINRFQFTEATGRPESDDYVEIIFPSNVSIEILRDLFTMDDEYELPLWTFDRMFVTYNEQIQSLDLQIISVDQRRQFLATIDNLGAYETLFFDVESNESLQPYTVIYLGRTPIYLPQDEQLMRRRTFVAETIHPESFINALFSNPSLVKSNRREAYFTDGQRGMRIFQEGRHLEYINPVETDIDKLDPVELTEKSIEHINEHKGWVNDYLLESVNHSIGKVQFRLYYEGYPVYDQHSLATIEQVWRERELYQYRRPLLYIGHLLNHTEVEIPGGNEVIEMLYDNEYYSIDKIRDVRLGYFLSYLDESHSLTLEPAWFIQYEGDWIRLYFQGENQTISNIGLGRNMHALGSN